MSRYSGEEREAAFSEIENRLLAEATCGPNVFDDIHHRPILCEINPDLSDQKFQLTVRTSKLLPLAWTNHERNRTAQLRNRDEHRMRPLPSREPTVSGPPSPGPAPKTPRQHGVLGGHRHSRNIVSDDTDSMAERMGFELSVLFGESEANPEGHAPWGLMFLASGADISLD
jgi:hypothetical protein